MSNPSTELVVQNNFHILLDRYSNIDPELRAELEDELQDLEQDASIAYRKIKVPSGGLTSFIVQGENENDENPVKNIQGVILFTHRVNAYWPGSYGDDNQEKVPLCSSMDGKNGLNMETGTVENCDTCPWNRYGTAIGQDGKSSRGKACKNMRRLYLMMHNDPNIYLLTVPPTSIREVNRQLRKIVEGGTPYGSLVVSLTLNKEKSRGNKAYSKIALSPVGKLPDETANIVLGLRQRIKEQYQSMGVTLDDYTSEPKGKVIDVDIGDFSAAASAPEDVPPPDDAPPEWEEVSPC